MTQAKGRRAARERAHSLPAGLRRQARGPGGIPGAHLSLAFLDDSGRVAFDRVSDRLGLTKAQFAETLGLSAETLQRASRANAPHTQARAAEALEIIVRVAEWAGGERQALAWYRAEPIPAFGGRTAESLVKEGMAGAVRDYLDHVATGGFA
ncbi:MAG: hypothetical protein K0S06_4126 [Microvirga sp.]|jgi:uncharacterized protein (DUF2384 family)|nr:hypothetical protein [Microvirga sp.]